MAPLSRQRPAVIAIPPFEYGMFVPTNDVGFNLAEPHWNNRFKQLDLQQGIELLRWLGVRLSVKFWLWALLKEKCNCGMRLGSGCFNPKIFQTIGVKKLNQSLP
jgi:hypothetical protein